MRHEIVSLPAGRQENGLLSSVVERFNYFGLNAAIRRSQQGLAVGMTVFCGLSSGLTGTVDPASRRGCIKINRSC